MISQDEIRRIVYTTNAIENLNSRVRRSVQSKDHFPNDQAATKLIWLSPRDVEASWKRPPTERQSQAPCARRPAQASVDCYYRANVGLTRPPHPRSFNHSSGVNVFILNA